MATNKNTLVYLALILIQVLFGVNFSTSKIVVGQIDPILWSNLRFLLAAIGMLVITLVFRRKHPPLTWEFFGPLLPLSLLGMSLGQGLFLFGLKYTSSTNTAILTSSIPILTLFLVVVRGQEELNLYKLLGLLISFLGVLFIRDFESFKLSSDTFMGDLMVFLGAFCFAGYLSFGKKYFQKFDNMWATTWLFFISGMTMSLYNLPLWLNYSLPNLTPLTMGSAAYTIIGATLLTYLLNNWALKHAPSGRIALFIYLQPVIAACIGYFFLGEILTLRMLISAIMIMSGVVLSLKKV